MLELESLGRLELVGRFSNSENVSYPEHGEAAFGVSPAARRRRDERAQVVRRGHHNGEREHEHHAEKDPEAEAVDDTRDERPLGQLRVLLRQVTAALGDCAQLAQHMPQRHAHRTARARHQERRVGRRRVPLTRRVCLLRDAYSTSNSSACLVVLLQDTSIHEYVQ